MRASPRDRIELRLRLAAALFLISAVVFGLSLWRTRSAHRKLAVLEARASALSSEVGKLRRDVEFLRSLPVKKIVLLDRDTAFFFLDAFVKEVLGGMGYRARLLWQTRGGEPAYTEDFGIPGFGYLSFELRIDKAYNYPALREVFEKLLGVGVVITAAVFNGERLVLTGRMYCRGQTW